MQDEVTKHTKKIYDTVKSRKHSFAEKLKEILIEICIIVFAVTLSIWLHSWSEHRHEQKEVSEFLKGLKEDLSNDIDMIEKNKKTISGLDSNYHVLHALKNEQPANSHQDSLEFHFEVSIPVTRPNIGRYDGFKSSGKIGNIENGKLKQNILTFYQQTIPDLVYGENFVNSLQLKILDLLVDRDIKKSLRDFATMNKTKSLLNIGIYNFNSNINGYDQAIKQAKEIIA